MKLGDILGLTNVDKKGDIKINGLKVKVWKAYQSSDEKKKEEEKTSKDFVPPLEWLSEENI